MIIKNVKHVELNISVTTFFLEYKSFKDDLIKYKLLCCNKKYKHKFEEKLKSNFLIYISFLTTAIISLFFCCKKVFVLMNMWMIGKSFVKYHYLKKVFTVT